MADRTEYCVGFLFDATAENVLLIRKLRPAWQAGRLNGIGGHIEAGEHPGAAMIREFEEEAGFWIDGWEHAATMVGSAYRLDVFSLVSDVGFKAAISKTDELIERVSVPSVFSRPDVLPNLRVHLAISLDRSGIIKPVHLVDERMPG